MTDIDKFLSDADKLVARASSTEKTDTQKLAGDITRLFLIWSRDFGELGTNLSAYWIDAYTETLSTEEGRKHAVEWFGSILALLSDCFTKDMDFSDRDWEEIRDSISDEAENLDMELITSIMTIIVDRGKA